MLESCRYCVKANTSRHNGAKESEGSLIKKLDRGWGCGKIEVHNYIGDDILPALGVDGYGERI